MPAFQDLVGQRFGKLLVLSYAGKIGAKNHWRCICDDGNAIVVAAMHLKNKHVQSCGCLRKETAAKQGHINSVHGKSHTNIYKIWSSMMQRCYVEDDRHKYWFGMGVYVVDRWHRFENFLADMGERPWGCALDRYPDNDGPYGPENCRWATMKEQQRNRRNNVLITHNGKTMCIREWAEETGRKYQTLYYRLVKAKWTPEKALF